MTKINKHGTINSERQMNDIIRGAKFDGYHKLIVHAVPNPNWPRKGDKMVPRVSHYWLVEISTTLPGWPTLVQFRFVYCGTKESFANWCHELETKADQVLSADDRVKTAEELEAEKPVEKAKTFLM